MNKDASTIIPTSLDEAVKIIIENMTFEELVKFTASSEKDLDLYHFTLGNWIRNNFKLFNENNRLIKDIIANNPNLAPFGSTDPDSVSSFIIECVWKRLQYYCKHFSGIPIELPENMMIKFLKYIDTEENTGIAAIKSINRRISEGAFPKEIIEKSKQVPDSGYIFDAYKDPNHDKYRIDFGYCAGGEAGDIGEWAVVFDEKGNIQECKLISLGTF